jgi:hypothetical protein
VRISSFRIVGFLCKRNYLRSTPAAIGNVSAEERSSVSAEDEDVDDHRRPVLAEKQVLVEVQRKHRSKAWYFFLFEIGGELGQIRE